MIDRQHLALMREIDRQGGLTAAAERLNMTQSAASHALRRLEAQTGVTLWRREGRRMRPTQAGRTLLDLARRLLPQFERADAAMADFAKGRRGLLRIGMECHPCYRWLLKVVEPYLVGWPDVDVDVRQAFQFGGLDALTDHEVDLLITPDPVARPGVGFTPVFGYDLVLAVARGHPLAGRDHVRPEDLDDEVLITYPVGAERLDIYAQFLGPAQRQPRARKEIETTDIMLQMVAAGRGVAPLPDWLLAEYAAALPIVGLPLGPGGLRKSIHVGLRDEDAALDYVAGFMAQAARVGEAA